MTKAAADPIEQWALPASQDRSRALRGRLLEAGERVFAAKGYVGSRLSEIAEEAGCSVGAVYFRFKDKDALFFAIAESFAAEARAGLAARLAGVGAMARDDIVKMFVTEIARAYGEHPGLFRAIIERGFDQPQVMQVIFSLRDELADGLEMALGGARGARLPVRVMTQMLYGFLIAGVLNPKAPTRLSDRATIDELVKACRSYLLGSAEASLRVPVAAWPHRHRS